VPRKKSGRTAEENWAEAVEATCRFLVPPQADRVGA
jgi:hypothetical protein